MHDMCLAPCIATTRSSALSTAVVIAGEVDSQVQQAFPSMQLAAEGPAAVTEAAQEAGAAVQEAAGKDPMCHVIAFHPLDHQLS